MTMMRNEEENIKIAHRVWPLTYPLTASSALYIWPPMAPPMFPNEIMAAVATPRLV